MNILTLLQGTTQQPMQDEIISILNSEGGIVFAIAVSMVAGAVFVLSIAYLLRSIGRGRNADVDATKTIFDELKDSIETIKKDAESRTHDRDVSINKLREGQAVLTEQVAHLSEQVNLLTGERNALFKTNEALAKHNYKIATDLGEATESKRTLLLQLDDLKNERARLQKERDDCHTESAKERDAYNVQIQVKTARIAALESELADKNAPPEATEIKINAAITLESPGESPAPNVSAEGNEVAN